MAVLVELIGAAVAFVALLIAALGLGRGVLAWADRRYGLNLPGCDLLLLGWIAGLGAQMFIAGALLLAGVLNPITAWATVFGGVACAARQRGRIVQSLGGLPGWKALVAAARANPLMLVLLVPAALFAGYGAMKAALPIDSWDAISSHMAYAKVWATHGLVSFRRISFLAYPKGVFALYALVYSLGFEPLLIGLNIVAVFVAGAVIARITRLFCDRRPAGLIAAVLFVSIPAIRAMAYEGKPYLIGCLFELAFVYLLIVAASRPAPAALWAAAGVFGGLAVGSVINAVYTVALFTPAAAMYQLAAGKLNRKGVALLVAAVVVVGCPSYIASWVLHGNPVYPMMPGVFGDNAWTGTPESSPRLYNSPDLPLSPAGYLRAWAHLFADKPLTRGWGGGFGLGLLLGLIPLCALWVRRRGLLLALLVAAGLYSVVWFLGVQVPRGMMMVMAMLSAVGGLNLAGLWRIGAPARSLATCAAVATVGVYATVMIHRTSHVSPTTVKLLAQCGREARLERMFANLPQRPMPGRLEYKTLQFLNSLDDRSRLLAYPVFSGRYYVDTYLDVIPYQSPEGALLDSDSEKAAAELRRLGVDYVLFDRSFQQEVKDDAWNDPATPGGKIYRFRPLPALLENPPPDVLEPVFVSESDDERVYRVLPERVVDSRTEADGS